MITQQLVISNLKQKLSSLTELAYIGEAPEGYRLIGEKYPAVLVADEGEVITFKSGGRTQISWLIALYLYHNQTNNRLQVLNELQNRILTSLLNDLTINNCVVTILPDVEVEKGSPMDPAQQPEAFTPGYYDHLSVRRIAFQVLYYQTPASGEEDELSIRK